ncbi:hypothetical protein [Streptomyces sp. NPDC057253]|uniref:hypothetical protein n=1 Tax=Streptomyces sp. NPDC057253 TaxID=3346069 RepID=UPI00363384AB
MDRSGSLGGGATTAGVFRCETPDGASVLFKEYRPEICAEVDPDALRRHVWWRQRLPPSKRRSLDSLAAWPITAVRRERAVIGVLMNEAPRAFFEEADSGKARDLSVLVQDADYSARFDSPYYPPPRKLAALGHLLESLAFFHDLGVVVGDLQPRNILTTGLGDVPRVYFLDCDAYVVSGNSPFRSAREPVPWQVPGADGFSEHTDLYKAALMVARCLDESMALRGLTPRMFSDVLPSADVRLLCRLTRPDPALRSAVRAAQLRPTARGWQSLVKEDGTLYVRNDTYAMVRWPLPPRGSDTAGRNSAEPPQADDISLGQMDDAVLWDQPDDFAGPRKRWLRRLLDLFRWSPERDD